MNNRLTFVDLLRGWSILFMLEAHVFNALINPALKETPFFSALNFIHGIVAPAFLFVSGFVFILSSRKKLEDFRTFGFQFWRQIGRIFLIFLTGYLIHLPYKKFSLIRDYSSRSQLELFYSVDILQCIGFGLLSLFLLRLFIKRDKIFKIILILLSFIIIAFSNIVWSIDFIAFLPLPLADYFVPHYGSLFPLFPWLGFMYAGAVMSSFFIDAKINNDEKKYFKMISIIALGFILVGYVILFEGVGFLRELSLIRPNPFFIAFRLGVVILLLVSFRFYEYNKGSSESFVTLAGKESFLIYWLHLQIIYRRLYEGVSLNSLVGQRFNFIDAYITTFILAVLMIFIAFLWQSAKKYDINLTRKLLISGLSIYGIYFFFF